MNEVPLTLTHRLLWHSIFVHHQLLHIGYWVSKVWICSPVDFLKIQKAQWATSTIEIKLKKENNLGAIHYYQNIPKTRKWKNIQTGISRDKKHLHVLSILLIRASKSCQTALSLALTSAWWRQWLSSVVHFATPVRPRSLVGYRKLGNWASSIFCMTKAKQDQYVFS